MGQNPPASQACQEKRWGSGGVQCARSSAQACGGGVKDLVRDAEVLGPPGKCLCIPFHINSDADAGYAVLPLALLGAPVSVRDSRTITGARVRDSRTLTGAPKKARGKTPLA